MTQNDLNREVANVTGEAISTIAAMGFVPLTAGPVEMEIDREPFIVDWDEIDRQRRFSLFQQHPRRQPVAV